MKIPILTPKPKGKVTDPMSLAGMLHRKGRRPVSVREMDRAIERLHRSRQLV